MAMTGSPVRLTLGTKESVPIKITDSLGNLTTLSGTDLRFDLIREDDDETVIIDNAACTNDGMIATPLIDTTAWDAADEDHYKIFLNFVNGSEQVRLGPFRILVDD